MCGADGDFLAGFLVGGFITVVAICLIGGVVSDITSERFINMDAKVESVVLHDSYMTVDFDTGETYNININTRSVNSDNRMIDFDESDHVVVRLRWSSGWLSPNFDDCWGIVSLVKY
jgi:hypothetical protein